MSVTVPRGWRGTKRERARAEKLLQNFEPMIVKHVHRLGFVGGGYQFEDLLQEGRLLAYWAIATWKRNRGRSLESWIYLVLGNNLLKIKRHNGRRKRNGNVLYLEPDQIEALSVVRPDPDEGLRREEEERLVEKVFLQLRPIDQKIIKARMEEASSESRKIGSCGFARHLIADARKRAGEAHRKVS